MHTYLLLYNMKIGKIQKNTCMLIINIIWENANQIYNGNMKNFQKSYKNCIYNYINNGNRVILC